MKSLRPPLAVVPLQACAPPAAVDKDPLVAVAAKEQIGPVKVSDPFNVPYSNAEDSEAEMEVEDKHKGDIVVETMDLVAEGSRSSTSQGSSPNSSGESNSKGSGGSNTENVVGEGEKEETSSGYLVATGDPAEVAARLGCPYNMKIIGGKAKGVLQILEWRS